MIKRLREALGDSAEAPRFIETLLTRFMLGMAGGAFGPFRPFWSPDGRFVAFFEGENSKADDRLHYYLKKADVTTGLAQTICETQDSLGGGSWSQDGVILFSQAKFSAANGTQARALYRVAAEGGEVRPVLELDSSRAGAIPDRTTVPAGWKTFSLSFCRWK